jgi:monothiol glutaredoxin
MTLSPELKQQLDDVIKENKIVVFMKGTKLMPMCGFSNNVVQILNSLGVPFHTINVLDNEAIRQGIKEYSNWPTIPQVYIDGEFVGGSDIIIELLQSGELQQKVEVALAS